MSAFDLRKIEFQDDGVRDSLTMAMTPELFHENLKREMSSAKRATHPLLIVPLVLGAEGFASKAVFQEA